MTWCQSPAANWPLSLRQRRVATQQRRPAPGTLEEKMQPETPTLETVIHRFTDGTTTSQVNILSDEGTKDQGSRVR